MTFLEELQGLIAIAMGSSSFSRGPCPSSFSMASDISPAAAGRCHKANYAQPDKGVKNGPEKAQKPWFLSVFF